ncbi:unnamed protein product [Acanthoscelides obtectus]|uniref:Uncharacterized protein n=1 Tax=Acanthoscelides obtectus TaxID=200917 RepID=A0A9P0PUM3_ACAOB|nr:unnamed protein product [Acanthoscelides obtectus]CAK1683250.1 hypothetical protein AOBTE_LOCUS34166 [Acanthoscelides obtectus]
MGSLRFKLVDMTYEELMCEINDADTKAIPSYSGSIVDDEVQNIDTDFTNILQSDSESDSESDLPLLVLQMKMAQNKDARDWSKDRVPKERRHFIADAGITDILKNLDSPNPGNYLADFRQRRYIRRHSFSN